MYSNQTQSSCADAVKGFGDDARVRAASQESDAPSIFK